MPISVIPRTIYRKEDQAIRRARVTIRIKASAPTRKKEPTRARYSVLQMTNVSSILSLNLCFWEGSTYMLRRPMKGIRGISPTKLPVQALWAWNRSQMQRQATNASPKPKIYYIMYIGQEFLLISNRVEAAR